MSGESALQVAALAALRGVAGLNGVYPGAPVKATPPYAELGDLLGLDWSVKDRVGREVRLQVTLRDVGDSPARVQALADSVGAAIEGLPGDLGGWCIASLVLVRTRLGGGPAGRWSMSVEYRVRMLAV
jgi:hypothetical protein